MLEMMKGLHKIVKNITNLMIKRFYTISMW